MTWGPAERLARAVWGRREASAPATAPLRPGETPRHRAIRAKVIEAARLCREARHVSGEAGRWMRVEAERLHGELAELKQAERDGQAFEDQVRAADGYWRPPQ